MCAVKQSVLVIGHADADGHLITEQVRRNLSSIKNFEVKTVVDPVRTKDHKVWKSLDTITEIEDADLVFFVDLMFAPNSFDEEAEALVKFVSGHKDKQFFLIDHHPLPLRRLSPASQLRVLYRPDVFDCALGPRSGMMVVASLCEGQKKQVADIREPIHDTLAVGMRRAAALGGDLPGEKLLALLRANCWSEIKRLGEDSREFHRLPRGRRSSKQPKSETLTSLSSMADEILGNLEKGAERSFPRHCGRPGMPYDADVSQERYDVEDGRRRRTQRVPAESRDLEAIVTTLEVAAIFLTPTPGATFTRQRLLEEAQKLNGDEVKLREEDLKIVLKKHGFVKSVGGGKLCIR